MIIITINTIATTTTTTNTTTTNKPNSSVYMTMVIYINVQKGVVYKAIQLYKRANDDDDDDVYI